MKLDKKRCKILKCTFADITHIFSEFHYKQSAMGGGISVCFAMIMDGNLVGGSVLGKPRHEEKYKNCIDIRRMACLDSSPKNSESYFLGQIIKWISRNTKYENVLSYSDLTVGHEGIIYKASNFKDIGLTAPTKWIEYKGKSYHMRSLTIDRDYSYKIREGLENGDAEIKTGKPKKIWMYEIKKRGRNKKMILGQFTGDGNQLDIFDLGA